MRKRNAGLTAGIAVVLALVPLAGWYGFRAGQQNPVVPRFPQRRMAPPAPTGTLPVRLVLEGFFRETDLALARPPRAWDSASNLDNVSMSAPDLVKAEAILGTKFYPHPPYVTRQQARNLRLAVEKALMESGIEVTPYADPRTNFPNQLGSAVVHRTLLRDGDLAVMRLHVIIREPNPLSFGPDPIEITEDYMGARQGVDSWKWSVEQTVRAVGMAAKRMKSSRDSRRQSQVTESGGS